MGDIGGVGGNEAETEFLIAPNQVDDRVIKIKYKCDDLSEAMPWNQYIEMKQLFLSRFEGNNSFEIISDLLKKDIFGQNQRSMTENDIQTIQIYRNNELTNAETVLRTFSMNQVFEQFGSDDEFCC